jgi:predicted CoA-substrate-specific enzyme activase
MKTAGIDIGSRTIKLVIIDDQKVVEYKIEDTGVNPVKNAEAMINKISVERIVATGYGRYLAQSHLGCPVITEIKAYALGAHYMFPECRTVLDIGGQDTKIIKTSKGKVQGFEMNDRCAAGTGRFLEVMATTLGYTIEQLGEKALKAHSSVSVNSMCTVFAESEVVSLIARGESPQNIALGLHNAIVSRILALAGRIGFNEKVVFAGGVAKNPCMVTLLRRKLDQDISVPDEPQIIGAIGAALCAREIR